MSSGPWPNSGEGTNWLVHILPYIEQGNIYNKLTFTGDSGWTNVPSSATSSYPTIMLARMPPTWRA